MYQLILVNISKGTFFNHEKSDICNIIKTSFNIGEYQLSICMNEKMLINILTDINGYIVILTDTFLYGKKSNLFGLVKYWLISVKIS